LSIRQAAASLITQDSQTEKSNLLETKELKMNNNLFKLALDKLEPSDWAHFERLCSAFFSQDFPALRTMASQSGDGGRDAELYNSEQAPLVALQYSVTTSWKTKIKQTAKTLSKSHPTIKILIFASNQVIGALGDEIRLDFMSHGLSLDIRDRNWFLERSMNDAIREAAAMELVDRIARPYLAGESIINKPTSPLNTGEARAALLYLGLQWQDDATDKGLTKLSFDALVRAALRNTSSDNRISKEKVVEIVAVSLPSADLPSVEKLVEAALQRLSKRYIRYWPKDATYCLTHEERLRIEERLADHVIQQSDYSQMVRTHCENALGAANIQSDLHCTDLVSRVPRILEKFLLRRGESFVAAVLADQLTRLSYEQLDDVILNDINTMSPPPTLLPNCLPVVTTIIRDMFTKQDGRLQTYLRRLSVSYTLLSFLNQTPDVQNATKKLFAHGTIWIDTTVVLPLIAEQLEEESHRRLTLLFATCKSAGIDLRVTSGVIQEVNAHMNIALSCSHHHQWVGRVPYLYYQYLETGRSSVEFTKWLSLFRGTERPDDDLEQYLGDTYGIIRKDLGDAHVGVGNDLRFAAERLWSEAHTARRSKTHQTDDGTTRLLIKHDVETYLGVIALRKAETVTELGYRHWLLTMDSIAWAIRDELKNEFRDEVPPSPLMSLSYLLDSMTFGSIRNSVGKPTELSLPLILDVEMSESMPHDFLEIASEVRKQYAGMPDYIIRRNVRDAIDRARRRRGCLGHLANSEHNGGATQ